MAIRRTPSTAFSTAPAATAPAAPALVVAISQNETAKEMGALIDAIFRVGAVGLRLPEEAAKAGSDYLRAVMTAAQAQAQDGRGFVEAKKAYETTVASITEREDATTLAGTALQKRLDEIEVSDPAIARAVYDERIAALAKAIKDLQPDTAALQAMKKFLENERRGMKAPVKKAAPSPSPATTTTP